jgi:hypothetical protein
VDAELKIKIGAETQGAEQGINKVTKALGNLKPGANQATFALTNLSRVAQDAPFGFIGIANNLDPLLNSFQQLKNQTGSVGGALKALGAGLLGPAGIAVGFSTISSLVVVAIQKYGSLSGALNALFGDTSALAKVNRELAVSFTEAQSKVAGEIATINSLIAVARDKTLSDAARGEAIKKLNDQYSSYLPNLNLENIGTQQVTDSVLKLNEALLRQAKIKGVQELISKEYEKQAQSLLEVQQIIDGNNTAAGKFLSFLQGAAVGGNAQSGFQARIANIGFASEDSAKKVKLFEDVLKKLLSEDATAGTLFKDTKKVKDKKSNFDPKQFFKESIVAFNEELYKLEKEAEKQFGDVGKKVGTKLSDTIGGNFNPESLATKLREKLQLSLNKAAELGLKLPDLSGFANDLSRLQFVDDAIVKFEKLREKAQQIGDTITNALSPALDSFFKTLLDGSGSPFKAFAEALKQMIVQLTATIAKALVLQLVLNAINPGQAVGKGFGSFFKQALSNFGGGIGSIANGGINVGGITGAANSGNGRLVAEVSGTALRFVLNKTNNSIARGF